MSNINLQNLTFKYENQVENLFNQLNLTLDTDWKTGLIGRNGRGKTTLLKILAGKVTSTYHSKLSYGYFPLTITDTNDYAVNLFEINPEDQWQVEIELAKLELDSAKLWQPFKTLSGGEQVKIMLAVLFSRDYDCLLLDEPTIYLDLPTKQIVKRYLQIQQQGFILVSHDMDFLNEVVDHIVSLEADDIMSLKGNYDVYIAERERLEKNFMMQNQKLKAEIKRLEQSAREKAEWSNQKEATKFGNPKVKGSKTRDDKGFLGSRAAKMMKKSKQMEDKINKQIATKEQQLIHIEETKDLSINTACNHHKILYEVQNLQLSYDKPLFQPVSFQIRSGNCLAIRGANGSGKSSLLKYLTQQFQGSYEADYEMKTDMKISYINQYFTYKGSLQQLVADKKLSLEDVIHKLRILGLSRAKLTQDVQNLSYGEQQKVALAISLSEEADVYLWDEPLTYLDLYNQEQVLKLLKTIRPTLVLVDHHLSFIEQVSQQIIDLK